MSFSGMALSCCANNSSSTPEASIRRASSRALANAAWLEMPVRTISVTRSFFMIATLSNSL
jgi:hypothetical protein